jgi:hypothetical protein
MLHLDGGTFVGMMAMAIPIVAIIGGITAGIVKIISQNRVIELAQRERIAAIERGMDPTKLPPIPVMGDSDDVASLYMPPRQFALRRAQGLLIGGIVTLSVGVGLGLMLSLLADVDDKNVWAVGLIPACIGIALIASALIVRSSAPAEDHTTSRK